MAVGENNVFKNCILAISRINPFSRVYRNNVGTGWQGPGFTLKPGQTYTATGGERVITRPSFIEFGLVKGSGDGIGYESKIVTPEMVGKTIAVFLSIETKHKGKATAEQKAWQKEISEAGGIALIVNDPNQISLDLPNN